MTSTSSTPLVRLSNPGDIVATIPTLCGFAPQDSLVVLSLRGQRKRLGLTIRLDLPPGDGEVEAAALLADRVRVDGGGAAVLVVFGHDRRARLVESVTGALDARGIAVTESLHVVDGRWTSYTCTRGCCPSEGTPVPAVPALVEAERALGGRAVLSSREELVRSLAAPVLLHAAAAAQALEAATVAWVREREADPAQAGKRALADARSALDDVSHGGSVDLPRAAAIAASLHDVLVRDEVATWSLKRSDALLSLAEQVARHVPAPYDAPVCTLLAWVAYTRGDGSRANVGLDRALATDPHYSLALLLRQALDGGVPPSEVRRTLRATKRALRRP